MTNIVRDESDIPWMYRKDSEDPIWVLCSRLISNGFRLADLVLPNEYPRFLELNPPDWDSVNAIWQAEGDTPSLRTAYITNTIREVCRNAMDGDSTGGMGPTVDDPRRVA